MAGHHTTQRGIRERISIHGTLLLETPAHFGNGRASGEALVDMSLLLDEAEGVRRALIPGATIAGALRNYLRERLQGFYQEESSTTASPITQLFGPPRTALDNDPETESALAWDQSLLIVDDALSAPPDITLRDGVRIDPKTATAYIETLGEERQAGAKFDVELLEAGVTFDLHFEVVLTVHCAEQSLLTAVATALQGLEQGEIRLGLRKRRGYGQCRVTKWTVGRYRLTDPAELCHWLETPTTTPGATAVSDPFIVQALGVQSTAEDQRKQFRLSALFGLYGSSVLIRSGFGESDWGPNMEHLHARNSQGQRVPVISGTSWAGVMRHRALRIANTLAGPDPQAREQAAQLVNHLFGDMPKGARQGKASKVTVDETQIQHGQPLYQTRVRIDRFTGGAYATGLFEQVPVYGRHETMIHFGCHVREPEPGEIGLLLLVLKDLWCSDLPVGGEASVGRGRLQGVTATINLPEQPTPFTLDEAKAALGLTAAQQSELQQFVTALWHALHDQKYGQKEESNGTR